MSKRNDDLIREHGIGVNPFESKQTSDAPPPELQFESCIKRSLYLKIRLRLLKKQLLHTLFASISFFTLSSALWV